MDTKEWNPTYSPWRHGGWNVHNVRYPSGACGCVSNNYADKQWRIVGGPGANFDETFATRDAAARAEYAVAQSEHERLAPYLGGMKDDQLKYSAVSLFGDIDGNPDKSVEELAVRVLRLRTVDAVALREAGDRYRRDRIAKTVSAA